jgi:uncharacterized protein (DUF2345 family)
MYNSCCDETIEITGNAHIVLDPDGSHFHLNFYNIIGAGSNGNTYHGGASESSHDNSGNGAENNSFTESFVMTSSNGCQFHVKITEHVTFNADGTGTAVVDSFDSECM